ncbi:hypothetical protein E3N88_34515 [Mikania micrantha]|uniref:Cardiolipin synthase N-terminal domain-containing protein n=1 Tax=Mikania micrantha TaxID=192012 RepID=A0A5N6LYC9_9ASTR|nr:hypothetical protein E3N88_34515 [Mikania micrantha]
MEPSSTSRIIPLPHPHRHWKNQCADILLCIYTPLVRPASRLVPYTQKSQNPNLEREDSVKIDGEMGGDGGGGGRMISFLILLLYGGLISKGNVPVFPFLLLSFFLGAYALIPYFILWRPPPPVTEETELKKWPLNFLESKLTAGVIFAVGLGLIVNAGLATGDNWKEYFQYFGGSRLIHVTSIDFTLLSSFAPFWVYNDMSARKWTDKGFWLLPLSVVPFLGPALYVLLRPSLSTVVATSLHESKEE